VPENFVVPLNQEHKLQSIDYESQIIDTNRNGHIDTGDFIIRKSNGDLIAGATYGVDPSTNRPIISTLPLNESISINYAYYHLVDEGGTIPSSNREGIKAKTIKLTTDVGDTDGDGTPAEKDDILGDDYTTSSDNTDLSPSSYNKNSRELAFDNSKKGHSVWIYYLPERNSNDNPTDNSIVGVVEGTFCKPDETTTGAVTLTNKITSMKKITVTELWRRGEKIRSTKVETFIRR